MPVKIKFFGSEGFKEINEFIERHEKSIRANLKSLGDKTAAEMKNTISSSKVRPQAGEPTDLEDNINVEHFPDKGWGVGDINQLNEKVKYWRAVNFGSKHLVGTETHGHFEPGEPKPNPEEFRKGRLKKGFYKIRIQNEIPAMNYIQRTVNFLRRQLLNLKFGERQ